MEETLGKIWIYQAESVIVKTILKNINSRTKVKIEYLADHKEVIPTLAQWSFEEWAYLHPGRTIEDVERLIAERANKTKIPIALVAFENKELLGTICLKMHDMETRQI